MSTLLLADAKSYLNIPSATTTNDDELQSFIDAAERIITEHCGPVGTEEQTIRVAPVRTRLALTVTPAISLTSVTPADGSALNLSDLHLDKRAGVVTYNSGAPFVARYYDVVYSAGRAECPDDLLMAVKELLRHLWSTQRGHQQVGPVRNRPATEAVEMARGAGYLLPNRVSALIAPHMQYGFA